MISIKLFLDKRQVKKDNTYAINFQICYNRKTTTRYSGITIKEIDWDKENKLIRKSHPSYKALNTRLQKDLAELQSKLILADEQKISEFLKPTKAETITVELKLTVFQFAQELIDELKGNNKIGNAWVYESTVNALKLFNPSPSLYFEDVDYKFMTAYHSFLSKKELKPNSIYLYLRTLRIFYNKAIKTKLVDRVHYPFHDFKLRPEKTRKRAVDIGVLKGIIKLKLQEGTMIFHARNFFLLSFCLIGISIVDLALLKSSNLSNGRITYKRRKTGKWYDIKLVPQALEIINQYSNCDSIYLLPITKEKTDSEEEMIRGIRGKTKTINTCLSKISEMLDLEPKITTYTSRHSWATIAKKAGNSIEIIAEALGHEQGNAITNTYLDKFDMEVIDEVNRKVIKAVYKNTEPNS